MLVDGLIKNGKMESMFLHLQISLPKKNWLENSFSFSNIQYKNSLGPWMQLQRKKKSKNVAEQDRTSCRITRD